MSVKFRNSDSIEEYAVSALTTLAVIAAPVLIILASF